MRFLADESCDAAIVRALRDAGHDVTAVADILRGADDGTVLDTAMRERRLLLTEDKDFGELVFAAGAPTFGVILFRYTSAARASLVQKAVARPTAAWNWRAIPAFAGRSRKCASLMRFASCRFGR